MRTCILYTSLKSRGRPRVISQIKCFKTKRLKTENNGDQSLVVIVHDYYIEDRSKYKYNNTTSSFVTSEATDQEASSQRCSLNDGDVVCNADLYVFNHEVDNG